MLQINVVDPREANNEQQCLNFKSSDFQSWCARGNTYREVVPEVQGQFVERPPDFIASCVEICQIDTRLRICFVPFQVAQGLSIYENEPFGQSHLAVGRRC